MNWIEVKTHKDLPKNRSKFLIWVKEDSMLYKFGAWHEAFFDGDNVIIEAGLSTANISDITHYMIPYKETPKS